ncbi:gliding motility-associated C-terminal domain-containing protein [Cytophagaceae bacterium ABcell3]|nr:gliding motility-associated C-terminal domain-containing protein [Cytophagaceae bacterium ABcell3]
MHFIRNIVLGCLLLIILAGSNSVLLAQSSCNGSTPSFTVDLSNDPDGDWESPNVSRNGRCCGGSNNCLEFIVTLHEDAERLRFDIASGAEPTGSMFYQVDCGPPVEVGEALCVSGEGPHYITFCKPGNNANSYSVSSIAKPTVSPPAYVSDGCVGQLVVEGYEGNTVQWTSVSPGARGEYDHYLSCTSNCTSPTVTAEENYPDSVVYEVKGVPAGGCAGDEVVQYATAYFVSEKEAYINPANPVICFGGSDATLTAEIQGGLAPYQYSWDHGPNTQSVDVGEGTYTVTVTDQTNCPPVSATVTVHANPSPIEIEAGPDVTSCENNPSVELSSTVEIATGVVWSGGNGTYDPSEYELNPVYTPTAAEIEAGTVQHVVSTVGNEPCPIERDTLIQTIAPAPEVMAGGPYVSCENNPVASLAGTSENTESVEWVGGNGTFFPNRNTINATYTASEDEVTAGSVTLTLRGHGHESCTPVESTATISFEEAPTVDAGEDVTVCANNSTVELTGEVTVASGGVWSGGDGTFSDANSLTTSYTPSADEIEQGTVVLTLTTTGNGLCNPVSDEVEITITPAPTVHAGSDRSVCANNAEVTLNGQSSMPDYVTWSGGDGGTFSPSENALNAVYMPSSTDIENGSVTLRLTADYGDCAPVYDEMVITYTDAPIVDAGNDQTVCANNSTVSLSGTVSGATGGAWSGGTGAFASTSSLNTTYTPSSADIENGSVSLVLSSTGNGNCLPERDTVVITILPAPVVEFTAPAEVCANNAEIALDGSIENAGGGEWVGGNGTFSPDRSDLTASYTPSDGEISAGTVALTLRSVDNGLCNPVEESYSIAINPAPIIDAGSSRTVCANNADVVLSGAVSGATGGAWTGGDGTFSPDRNTLNATYSPSEEEKNDLSTVQLTLTSTGNGGCNPVSDNMSITITPAPVVDAGDDRSVCANNPSLELNGTVAGASGGEWVGGAGTFNPGRTSLSASYTPSEDEIENGTVSLTLRSTGNGNCLPVEDIMNITITPAPTADAGTGVTVCANNSDISLNGAVTIAAGGEWIGGNGSFSPDRQALDATYTPSSGEISSGSVELTLRTTGNDNCAAVTSVVTHTITPAPTVDAGTDQMVCANNAEVTLNGAVTLADGASWSGGNGTFSPNAEALDATYTPSEDEIDAGEVTLRLTSNDYGTCQPVYDEMTIAISPAPTADVGVLNKQVVVCSNNPNVDLNGSVTVAGGGEWVGGMGSFIPNNTTLNATYVPSAAETAMPLMALILQTTDNGNCLPARDTLRIYFLPPPVPNAGPDQEICVNNPQVQLAGTVAGASQTRTWSGGNGSFTPNANTLNAVYNPTDQELENGYVNLRLTASRTGCNPVSDEVRINFTPAPVVDAGPDMSVCSNNPDVQLAGEVENAGGGIWSGGNGSFSPSPNALGAVYSPTPEEIESGSITLTLTSDDNGNCLPVSDQMEVNFTPAPTVDAGDPQSVCYNNASVSLDGSVTIATGGQWIGGEGTFSPNANALNATYIPSESERENGSVQLVLRTTGNGGCLPVESTLDIAITPAPIADAGPDLESCMNNPAVQLSGTVSVAQGGMWIGGSGSFSPSRTSLNPTYTPTSSEMEEGEITLNLVTTGNANCNQVSDIVRINVVPTPVVDAGSNQTLCGTVNEIQLNGEVSYADGGTWSTSGSGSFAPNASALDAQYIPSDADRAPGNTVTLSLTSSGNGSCLPVTDQLNITFTEIPTVDAGSDKTVCTNDFPVRLEGSGSPARWSGGNGTFAPNRETHNATYTPSEAEIEAGSVTLTLTTIENGPCAPVSSTVTISLPPGPIVNAGQDQIVCGDISSVSLDASVENASGGTWTTTGTGSFDPGANTVNASYVPSAADKDNGHVTLRLTSTGNGACSPTSDTMELTITPPPTANAGPNMTRCADISGFVLNGQVTVATGGLWTITGSGSFDPDPSVLNATYVPSQEDIDQGFVDFTLTTTGNGTCNPVTDNMRLTLTPAPTSDAGEDVTICADSAHVAISGSVTVASGGRWSSSGTGTFAPNNTTLDARYYPSSADTAAGGVVLTLLTTGNGTCNPVTDELEITINPVPVVDAGDNLTICADAEGAVLNGSVLHADGGVWSSSGSGSFVDANDLGTMYEPSFDDMEAGVVMLTLTSTGNGMCNPVNDRTELVVTPAPTVDAGGDITVCADAGTVSMNGAVTVASGGQWTTSGTGTFDDDDSLNATYTPSQSDIDNGSVVLTLTSTGNGNCNPVTDELTLTITPAPVVNAGEDLTVCGDLEDVQLDGSVTVASGGQWTSSGSGYFTPNASALDAVYHPSASDVTNGGVTLSLRSTGNGTCNAVEDQMELTITPVPVVDAGDDMAVCANNADIQLNGSVTVATGGEWSGGAGTFSPDASALDAVYTPSADEIEEGTVTLMLTSTGNGTCNPVSDYVTFTITPAPVVNAGNDRNICANNSTVNLNGSVTIAQGGEWSGGEGVLTPNRESLSIAYTPSQAEIDNGYALLTLTSTGNGNCAPVSDEVRLNISPAPVVDAGADQVVCANNADVQLEGSFENAGGVVWSGGTGSFAPNANDPNAVYYPSGDDIAAGQVTLTLRSTDNGNCLEVWDEMEITITPAPVVDAGNSQTICADASGIQLEGSVTVATGGEWSTSGTGTFNPGPDDLNAVYVPSDSDIASGGVSFVLTSTGMGDCNAVTDNVSVTITPAPTVNAGSDRNVCADVSSVSLNGSVTVATGGAWTTSGSGTFTPNANTLGASYVPSAADTAAGNVTLTLTTTGNGLCNAVSDDMLMSFQPKPVVNAGSDVTVCADVDDILLDEATVANASGGRWATDGTGSFVPNAFDINATYVFSDNDKERGYVRLTLASEGNGLCEEVTDQIRVNITPAPTVNAGPNRTICAGGSVNLNGIVTVASGGVWSTSSGTGTFSDPNSLSTTFTPTAAQVAAGQVVIRLTTTGNGTCNPVSDNMVLTIQPQPVVSAGFNQTVCETVSAIQLNGSVQNASGGLWTTTGTGTFSPDANALDAEYIPSAEDKQADMVTLTLTSVGNSPCSAVSRNIIIRFSRQPTVDAGSATICSNSSSVPLSATFENAGGVTWTTSGSGTFSPSATSASPSYRPSAGDAADGSVTITVATRENGGCEAATQDILISIVPPPTADAGTDQIVCANNPEVPLSGSVGGTATGGRWTSSGGGSFTPSNESLNASYRLSAVDRSNGFAELTLTTTGTGECASVSDRMRITVTPAPTANAGPDKTVCADTAGVELSGAVTIADGGTWTTSGNGTFSDPDALNTTYIPDEGEEGEVILTLTTTGNGNCVPVSDQMTLTIEPAPTVNAGNDVTICSDNEFMIFTANVTGATEGVWTSSGEGSFNTNYANKFRASYAFTEDDYENGEVTLTYTTTEQGLCKPVSDDKVITLNPAPTVTAGAANVCADSDIIPVNGDYTIAGGVIWTTSGAGTFGDPSDPITNYYVDPADRDSGTVILTITTIDNDLCMEVSDSIIINFGDIPVADAGPDQVVCANNAVVTLDGNSSTGAANWSSLGSGSFSDEEDFNASYIPSSADTAAGYVDLVLTTLDNGFCSADTDTMRITITPAPYVNAGPAVICANAGSVDLDATITVASGGVWSTPDGTGDFGDENSLLTTYTLSAADEGREFVTLVLTSVGNGDCNPVSDTIILNIAPPPTADAGDDQVVCADTDGVQLAGVVSGADGGTWTTSGSGAFDDGDLLDAVYHPSAEDTTSGMVTLTLTTTGNGNCFPVSDSLELILTPAPTVDAGPAIVCANNGTIDLEGTFTVASGVIWTTTGDGDFGNPADAITTYTLGSGDVNEEFITITITTTGNGDCKAVSDEITLYIADPPVAEAGLDLTVCADTAQIELDGFIGGAGGGEWSSSGTGTFGNVNDLTTAYIPSAEDTASGRVVLTLSTIDNGNCNAVHDSIEVIITPAPVISAGPDKTACADEDILSLTGSVTVASQVRWTTSGTGTFTDANNVLSEYQPSEEDKEAGSVTLTLETLEQGDCKPVSDAMVLTILPVPVVDAGAESICSDNTGVQLNGMVENAGGAVWTTTGTGSFAPNASRIDPIYIPSDDDRANGSVELTITSTQNGRCQAYSDNLTLYISPTPAADAGPDVEICANSGGVQLSGAVANAPGGVWTTSGSGTFDPSETDLDAFYVPSGADTIAGSVVLRLTTAGMEPCIPAYDEMTLSFTPAPIAVVNAGEDTTLCFTNPEVPLQGFISVATGGMWETTNGTGFFTPNQYSMEATYIPSEEDIDNGEIELVLRTTGNGDCIPVTDTMVVTYLPRPRANAGDDFSVCADFDEIQLDGETENAPGAMWSTSGSGYFSDPENPATSYIPSEDDKDDGFVILTLFTTGNVACDEVFDNVRVTIDPAPEVNAGRNVTVCADAGGVPLNGSVKVAGGGEWSVVSGNGTFSDVNDLAATYYLSSDDSLAGSVTLRLTTIDNDLCQPVYDEVVITITDAPTIFAGDPQTVCGDVGSVALNGNVTVASGASWTSSGSGSFAPGSNALNASYYPSQLDIEAGSVELVLTSTGNGTCSAVSDVMDLTITPIPEVDPGENMVICRDRDEIQLSGNVEVATGGQWSTNGSGTFSDPTDLNAIYFPSDADKASGQVILTLVSTGNGLCNPVSRNMRIDFTPAPTVNAGQNRTVCADIAGVQLGGSVTVATGGVWSSTGSGTFSPSEDDLNAVYIPSDDDRNSTGVTLTLTTTGNGICNPVSSSINVTITPAPTVDPGDDVTVCADIDEVALNGDVTVATGGAWTSSGSGSFTPDTYSLNGAYIPSSQDRANGSVVLTLTTTGNGTCNPVVDQKTITITPAPTVDAGSNVTVCGNNAEVALDGAVTVATGGRWTGGNGTFSPNNETLDAVYTPSASEIAAGQVNLSLTTTGNGTCNAVRDNMRITITPAPTVDAGRNRTVCGNNADVQLSGTVTVATGGRWTGGTGIFIPSRNVLNPVYRPSAAEIAAGTVTLRLTSTGNGDCNAETSTVDITITPAPTVDAGNNQTICADAGFVQLNGAVTVATGGEWTSSGSGRFVPNAQTLDARYIPSEEDIAAGQVGLVLTTTGSGSCYEVNASMRVRITPAPTVDAGEDISICYDADSIQLEGSTTVATGAFWTTSGSGTFAPDPMTRRAEYIPSQADKDAGVVRLTLTTTGTGSCQIYSDDVFIRFTPRPTVDAGPPLTVCADVEAFELNGAVTVSTGGRWTTEDGTGSFAPGQNHLNTTYVPSEADTARREVTFTLTTTGNGTCQTYYTTTTVSINPAPVVSTGEGRVCADFSGAPISGSVHNATGGRWSTAGSGYFAPNEFALDAVYYPSEEDMAAGEAKITLTSEGNGTCNPVSEEMTVVVTELPVADAGRSQTICRGEQTFLLAQPVPNATYRWYSMSGEIIGTSGIVVVTVSQDTSFVLSVTDGQGCSVYDTVDVNVVDPPNLAPPAHACLEEGLEIDANPSFSLSGSYQWFRNDTLLFREVDRILEVEKPGEHMVVFSHNECMRIAFSDVTAPPALEAEDKLLCVGSNSSISTTEDPDFEYRWLLNGSLLPGEDSHSVNVVGGDAPGHIDTYAVTATDNLGCASTRNIEVVTYPPPRINVDDTDACLGDIVRLNAQPQNFQSDQSMYEWYRNGEPLSQRDGTLPVTEPGRYSVIYSLGEGECITHDTARVDFHEYPEPDMSNLEKHCFETDGALTLDAGPGHRYLWEINDNTARENEVLGHGTYYVTVFNQYGCGTEDSVVVEDKCPPRMVSPNAFAPGGDSRDREFRLYSAHIGHFSLTIFNRWGEIIFYTEDPEEGWDGTFRGEEMPPGVYPYIVKFESKYEEFRHLGRTEQGKVTLIR